MTAKQIQNKLVEAGIILNGDIEIARDEVTVCVGYEERNGRGTCDFDATEELQEKVSQVLGWKNGYTTGYGAWVLVNRKVNINFGNCM